MKKVSFSGQMLARKLFYLRIKQADNLDEVLECIFLKVGCINKRSSFKIMES